jgi:transcriptional regulator with XRE-family HTH domain
VALALIDYMQDNGLSRSDVADRLSVSPQYVSRILSGKVNFSFKSIAEIEEKLGVDCFRAAAIGV